MITGTANDAIFMMLPMVDNFWQAQVLKLIPKQKWSLIIAKDQSQAFFSNFSTGSKKFPFSLEGQQIRIERFHFYLKYENMKYNSDDSTSSSPFLEVQSITNFWTKKINEKMKSESESFLMDI